MEKNNTQYINIIENPTPKKDFTEELKPNTLELELMKKGFTKLPNIAVSESDGTLTIHGIGMGRPKEIRLVEIPSSDVNILELSPSYSRKSYVVYIKPDEQDEYNYINNYIILKPKDEHDILYDPDPSPKVNDF